MATKISNRQDIVTVLTGIKTELGIESAYSHFINGHSLPYLAYIGTGQSTFDAGNGVFWRSNTYQVELYFSRKDEALEESIEDAFAAGGWLFDKSDDVYLEDEGIFYIVYQLQ